MPATSAHGFFLIHHFVFDMKINREDQSQGALHRIEAELLALLQRVKPYAQLGAAAH